MVQLARQYKLFLHAHSDADAVERLFRQWPEARILWAHAGFERPENVREMLRKHRNLWCDLAFRTDHGARRQGRPGVAQGVPRVPRPLHGRHRLRSRRSAGTTSPSTPAGRARGSPTCRRTSPSASRTRTARRCSAAARRAERRCGRTGRAGPRRRRAAPASCRRAAHRIEPDWRFPSARFRAKITVGQHFAVELAVCPKHGVVALERFRSRAHARAPPRHELPDQRSCRWAPGAIAPRACCSTCPGAGNSSSTSAPSV